MTTFIAGGTGFIGRRLVPLLAQRGEEIVCMDINPQTADYSGLGKQVRVVRGDVSQFDDFLARIVEAKPDRIVNLAYYIGSDLPPRVAFKLNVLGMDNCFEAARLAGCNRVVYASSVAVSGEQKHYGERIVNETISATATCNTRCTRSSTSGRRRITARSTGWRSRRSVRPT
jgi:UDP-glucose 4-epimerase